MLYKLYCHALFSLNLLTIHKKLPNSNKHEVFTNLIYFIYNASVSKQLTEHTTGKPVSAQIAPTIKKKKKNLTMYVFCR
jgi:hypothetical protein